MSKPTYSELEERIKELSRQPAESELIALNRALSTLSRCTKAVMHAKSEPKLLNEICAIITESDGYPLAWVGYAEQDTRKTVRVMAMAGRSTAYLGEIEVVWADAPLGRGPTGSAIRAGKPSIFNELNRNPAFAPWREKANKFGIGSCIGLPLLIGGHTFGALTIYGSEELTFDENEVSLLQELAENLSYGIRMLRLENERRYTDERVRYLAKALDTTATGITISDLDGKILYVNPAEATMHGYSVEELVGRNVQVFAPPAYRRHIDFEEMTQLKERRRESINIHKNGTCFPVYLVSDVVLDDKGHPFGFVTTCEDITERKQAEEATRESEARLQAILDNSLAAIFVKDMDDRYVMLNRSLSLLLGRPAEEIIGRTDGELFPEEVAERLREMDRKVLTSGDAAFFEEKIPMSEGKVHTFITNKFPLKDTKGNIYALCGISTDITRRKEVEEETILYNVQLESIRLAQTKFIEQADPSVVFDNLLETLLTLTESGHGFIGRITEEKEKRHLSILTTPPWNDGQQSDKEENGARKVLGNMETLYGTVIKSGRPVVENKCRKDKNGRRMPPGHPLIDNFMGLPIYIGNRLIGMAGVSGRQGGYTDELAEFLEPFLATCGAIMDAATLREERETAKINLEISHEQLRNLVTRMETVIEDERKRIARDIHDELGQILTVIKFDIAWLARRISEAPEKLAEKLTGTSGLIDSAIESVQRISSELRPTLLDDLGIRAGMEWHGREFEKRTGIRCLLSFEPPGITLEDALSTEIYRIFQESLTNVARHSGATEARATLFSGADGICLEVADNGCGIEPEKISDNRSIGLIGIRERIRPWQGEVAISGVRGKGTTLRVTVPATGRAPESTGEEKTAAPREHRSA